MVEGFVQHFTINNLAVLVRAYREYLLAKTQTLETKISGNRSFTYTLLPFHSPGCFFLLDGFDGHKEPKSYKG